MGKGRFVSQESAMRGITPDVVTLCPPTTSGLCDLCLAMCSFAAISFLETSAGTRLAMIDGTRCADCGLCVGVCPVDAFRAPDAPPPRNN
jgi:ferredoxin